MVYHASHASHPARLLAETARGTSGMHGFALPVRRRVAFRSDPRPLEAMGATAHRCVPRAPAHPGMGARGSFALDFCRATVVVAHISVDGAHGVGVHDGAGSLASMTVGERGPLGKRAIWRRGVLSMRWRRRLLRGVVELNDGALLSLVCLPTVRCLCVVCRVVVSRWAASRALRLSIPFRESSLARRPRARLGERESFGAQKAAGETYWHLFCPSPSGDSALGETMWGRSRSP